MMASLSHQFPFMSATALPPRMSVAATVALLSVATFSSMASQRICDAMLPELARYFSVGLPEAAQVVSMFAVVYGVVQLFYGPLGDRIGKLKVISFATLLCGVGSLLAMLAPTLPLLVLARMTMALGAAAIIPLTMAWVGDSLPQTLHQETLARVGVGTTMGIVAGQLMGGLFTDALGWRSAFAVLALLFGTVTLLLMRARRQQAASGPPATTTSPAQATRKQGGFVQQSMAIVLGPWSRLVLLVALIEGAVGFGVLAIWASHLHSSLGLSLTHAGMVVALFGVGGMLYMAAARTLIQRWGQVGLVVGGTSLAALCSCVIAFAGHWAFMLPASTAAGFGFFMFHNTMQANATQMAPQARGTAVSLFASFLFLGQSLGVVLAAWLLGWVGSAWVIAGGGLALWGLGLAFALGLRRHQT